MHNPPDTLFPVGLVARALGRSVVFDHHDLFPELLGEKLGSCALVSIARLAQRASLRSATRGPGHQPLAGRGGARGGLRDAGALTIVRNGPKRATLAEASSARRGVLDDPHLVFVGELDSHDGVLALPELLAKPGLQRARLTLVGDGALRQELVRRCSRVGHLRTRRPSPGRSIIARVPELIAAADICVDPAPGTRAQPPLDDDQGHGVPGGRSTGGRLRSARDAADGARRRPLRAVRRPRTVRLADHAVGTRRVPSRGDRPQGRATRARSWSGNTPRKH